MNKRGIELSINFLVIVIISIVMLSTGLILIKNYFGTAEELKATLDEQTIAQIEELLDEGDPVAIPLKRKTIQAGEGNIFGLGVLNINQEFTLFTVKIEISSAFQKDKSQIIYNDLPSHPNTWPLYQKSFTLGYQDKQSVPIKVSIPGGIYSGTYIYNVEVFANNARYGLTKMYVIVP